MKAISYTAEFKAEAIFVSGYMCHMYLVFLIANLIYKFLY